MTRRLSITACAALAVAIAVPRRGRGRERQVEDDQQEPARRARVRDRARAGRREADRDREGPRRQRREVGRQREGHGHHLDDQAPGPAGRDGDRLQGQDRREADERQLGLRPDGQRGVEGRKGRAPSPGSGSSWSWPARSWPRSAPGARSPCGSTGRATASRRELLAAACVAAIAVSLARVRPPLRAWRRRSFQPRSCSCGGCDPALERARLAARRRPHAHRRDPGRCGDAQRRPPLRLSQRDRLRRALGDPPHRARQGRGARPVRLVLGSHALRAHDPELGHRGRARRSRRRSRRARRRASPTPRCGASSASTRSSTSSPTSAT